MGSNLLVISALSISLGIEVSSLGSHFQHITEIKQYAIDICMYAFICVCVCVYVVNVNDEVNWLERHCQECF